MSASKRFIVPTILLCVLLPHKAFPQPSRKQPTLVTYNGLTDYGRRNHNALLGALANLGITGYDTLDRNRYGNTPIDYTPWCTVIWSSGDPSVSHLPGDPRGQSGLTAKEIGEVERFLESGQTTEKKSFIIAGQNIAYMHGALKLNGYIVDSVFLEGYLHTKYVADSPVAESNIYEGTITGQLLDYNSFPDNIRSASPDVVKPAMVTPTVGQEVNWWAYSYNTHPQTPNDSGAGTTYRNQLINTVFYAFDWADPALTTPIGPGPLTSGVTRLLRGAIDFVASHGTVWNCPFQAERDSSGVIRFDLTLTSASPIASGRAEIQFSLPVNASITLRLVDVTGKVVKTELDGEPFFAGEFSRSVDLSNFANGSYFFQLYAVDGLGRGFTIWRKVVVER